MCYVQALLSSLKAYESSMNRLLSESQKLLDLEMSPEDTTYQEMLTGNTVSYVNCNTIPNHMQSFFLSYIIMSSGFSA